MSRKRAERFDHSAPVFAALGDATRLALIAHLCNAGPSSIAALTLATAITRQAVTKHLEVLAAVGLVSDLRSGRERVWQIEPAPLEDARRSLDRISQQWDAALDRLQALVED